MDDGVPYNGASAPTEAAELLVDAPSEQVQQELYAVDAPLAEVTDESDRLCQAFDGVPDGSLTGDMDSLVAESLQSVSDVADSISIELGRSVEPSIAGKSVGDADSDGDAEAAMSERSPLLESQEMTDRLRQLLLRLFPSHIVPAQATAPSAVLTTADKKVGSRKRSRIEGVGFTASLHEDRRHAVEFLHNVCEDKAFFHGAWRRYREASTHRAPCHPRRRIKTVFSPVVRRTRGDRGSSPPPSSCSCPVERFTFAPWVVMPASTASPSGEGKTAVAQGPNTTSDGHTMTREVEPTSHTPAPTRPVQARGPSVGAPVLSVDELRMFARHVMSSGRLRHECGEPYQFLMARLRELRQEPPLHP